jgi:LuxR family maltose regulon positive regulatory protein
MPFTALLQTKLHRPRLNDNLIVRPQLLERLDRGLDRKLILVMAPAGYGKTTLINQWLARQSASVAWLSLDKYDDDLGRFVRYFCAALQSWWPGCGADTLHMSATNPSFPADELAMLLAGEIPELSDKFLLVLDDYHFIHQVAIHQFLVTLIEYLPPSICLVIATRQEPPLNLSHHRSRQTMLEIRPHHLRFKDEEMAAYLEQSLGTQPSADLVKRLAERTEGWIVGLRLVVLALRDQPDPAAFLEGLLGSYHYAMEYLLDEILSRQPPLVQVFLLRTALLDRFCAPLAAALMSGPQPGLPPAEGSPGRGLGRQARLATATNREILDYLEQSHLFVVPLDNQGYWYRYHHLLQELLAHKLRTETNDAELAALHLRAGTWLAENGLDEEALPHLLAGGDQEGAARLVERARLWGLTYNDSSTLERRLNLLPPDVEQRRPGLLLARAWVRHFQFNFAAISPLLQAAESLLADPANDPTEAALLRSELDYLWGTIYYLQGEGEVSIGYLQRALAGAAQHDILFRGRVLSWFCLAAQIAGRPDQARQALDGAVQAAATDAEISTIQQLSAHASLPMLAGELSLAIPQIETIRSLATQANNFETLAWSFYLGGLCHYARNELAAAVTDLAQAGHWRYRFLARTALDSLSGLALAYQALGQPDQADETMTQLFKFARQNQNPTLLAVAQSTQAHLWLAQGKLEAAGDWLRHANPSSLSRTIYLWVEQPEFTAGRVLLAQGATASLAQAVARLQEYIQVTEETHNTWQLITLLPLLAAAYRQQGQTAAALAVLERAIALAQPGGFIRPFVEAGLAIADMLEVLARREVTPAYIGRILAAFGKDEDGRRKDEIKNLSSLQPSAFSPQPLLEPLTDRELDVLALLAQHRSNDEVAQVLHVTIHTVKAHCSHIYQKLDAKNRYQAVAKARALGLLPPNPPPGSA